MKAVDKVLAAGVPEDWLVRELNRHAGYHFERCGERREAAVCYADAGDCGKAASLFLETGELGRAAQLLSRAKRYDEALEVFGRWLEEEGEKSEEIAARALLGMAACLKRLNRDAERARELYFRAREIAENENGRPSLVSARCWEALGEYGVAMGRHDLVCVGFEKALAWYGEKYRDERLKAALAYLDAARNNRLLRRELEVRILEWSVREEEKGAPRYRLRSEGMEVSEHDAEEMFGLKPDDEEIGPSTWFYPQSYVENEYEDRGEVVFDHATGLMWQKSGSDSSLEYDKAEEYVDGLNREGFAGFADWRLPTVEELLSLMEPEKNQDGNYISPLFDQKQWWCWTKDKRAGGGAWLVYFILGYVHWRNPNYLYYVRVCRS